MHGRINGFCRFGADAGEQYISRYDQQIGGKAAAYACNRGQQPRDGMTTHGQENQRTHWRHNH
ncbi:hypothetical protein D3C78_1434540 [compost metagenome]